MLLKSLPRSRPEEQGISSKKVHDFLTHVSQKELELHSFMLVINGHVVSEGWWHPYRPDLPHMLFSLSKSFSSTAIGLAASEGLLTVDDPVLSFFPDYAPDNPSSNLSSMKVKHLLSMSTGHSEDTTGKITSEKNWANAFLSLPVEYEPGTHFLYNSGASYMLSAIIQKLTGQTVLEYLTPRLFKPLGIEGAAWESCPMGINIGGWGLSIKTEDIAKFGQLYLQKGKWGGEQLLSEDWVNDAASAQISNGDCGDNDWSHGYGYQFWRCKVNAYRGDGAFGQYCIVIPEKNAVIAITSGLDDMQAVLNLVWEDLLPNMGNELNVECDSAFKDLEQDLKNLSISPPSYISSSASIPNIWGKRYKLNENHLDLMDIEFNLTSEASIITIHTKYGHYSINCGLDKWIENPSGIPGLPGRVCASSGWQDENTFVITARFIETPFYYTYKCVFDGENIQMDTSINVSFGPKEGPTIEGKMI